MKKLKKSKHETMQQTRARQPSPMARLGAALCALTVTATAAAQPAPQEAPVRAAQLSSFLPAAPGQSVDAASSMPPELVGTIVPDALGRKWVSVVRTYWDLPIPGLGELPDGSSPTAILTNMLHHMQTGLVANPGSAPAAVLAPLGLIPEYGLIIVELADYTLGTALSLLDTFTDYVPGVPSPYQVSIDYFKVGDVQPMVSGVVNSTVVPAVAPVRELVGGFLRGVFGPVRGLVRGVVDQGVAAINEVLATALPGGSSGSCRLSYAQEVQVIPGWSWPPAVEAGFDCAGSTLLSMTVDVGASFDESSGLYPVIYEPFTGAWQGYIGIPPAIIEELPVAILEPIAEGMGLGPEGRKIPRENLVVTFDGVKSRETLYEMARSIDYVGLCRTVHPDGSGCP